MKKLTTVIMAALTSAAAFGELSWATVNTEKYSKDASPSAQTTAYTAYLCTVDAAKEEFGASSYQGVTDYFVNHFSVGSSALADLAYGGDGAKLLGGATLLDDIEWGRGQYSFSTYFASDASDNLVAGAEYLGILLYSSGDDQAVRVFKATATDTPSWTADDSTSRSEGTYGAWAAAVPEPTSGMLLLLGFAGLALRRKRAR